MRWWEDAKEDFGDLKDDLVDLFDDMRDDAEAFWRDMSDLRDLWPF